MYIRTVSDEYFQILNHPPSILEIDYQRTVYGNVNTTVAWGNTDRNNCNITRVLSYPPCQPRDIDIDVNTSKTEVTIPSENFHISGNLADFSISSSESMDQQSQDMEIQCPGLVPEIFRVNGEC